MKYWEIIADKLSASGWSCGMRTAIERQAGKLLFVVDAHRSDTRGRFIVQSDELLTAFLELERDASESTDKLQATGERV
jgi:hypothetical protein